MGLRCILSILADGIDSRSTSYLTPCAGVPLEDDYQNLQKYVCVAIREIPK